MKDWKMTEQEIKDFKNKQARFENGLGKITCPSYKGRGQRFYSAEWNKMFERKTSKYIG